MQGSSRAKRGPGEESRSELDLQKADARNLTDAAVVPAALVPQSHESRQRTDRLARAQGQSRAERRVEAGEFHVFELNALKNSAESWSSVCSVMGIFSMTRMSKLQMPRLRNVLRPERRRGCAGMVTFARAVSVQVPAGARIDGRSRCDASDSRPRIVERQPEDGVRYEQMLNVLVSWSVVTAERERVAIKPD